MKKIYIRMISIIICSINNDFFNRLSKNISNTIGDVTYEIIKIDNTVEKLSITCAYNKGVKIAIYPYLLFIHEDVEFCTYEWGRQIVDLFENNSRLGCVGLAGTKKRYLFPIGYNSGIRDENYNFIYKAYDTGNLYNVKMIDGVFIFSKKEIFEIYQFNENLTGFHFYDLDFSLRVSEKYAVVVIDTIAMNHFSSGNFGNEWVKAAIEFKDFKCNFDVPSNRTTSMIRRFWYNRLNCERINFFIRVRYISSMSFDCMTFFDAFNFLFKGYPKRIIKYVLKRKVN